MNHKATVLTFLAAFLLVVAAEAQPVRNGVDVIVARDIGGATLTLDGIPDEPIWAGADSLKFVWNAPPGGLPGSGQKVEGNPTLADPPDPINATMRVLRQNNFLWISWEVRDKSIGGGTGLWNFDGQIMSINNRNERADTVAQQLNLGNMGGTSEWFVTWWNPADTTDGTTTYFDGTPLPSGFTIPGDTARGFGDFGVGFGQGHSGDARTAADKLIWDWRSSMMGSSIPNDDTHGPDTGYYLEMFIDAGALGYDFDSDEGGLDELGDMLPFTVALQDSDYGWPSDPDSSFLSRVWLQGQWGNNFNDGVAYIYGDPNIVGPPPSLSREITEPEVEIYTVGTLGAPTLDGVLDEDVWTLSDTLFYLKYQSTPDELDRNPSLVPWMSSWFRPDLNGDMHAAAVVDPTEGRFKMVFEGSTLYVGLDTDDQAISGAAAEGGRDGFRVSIRSVDSTLADGTLFSKSFDFAIDSTGAIQYDRAAALAQTETPGAVTGVVALKGASTVADPADVDEGYSIEAAIDLAQVSGYPADLGDGRLWISLNFFDGDFLQAQTDSYVTRTWMLGERETGASLYVYANSDIGVATEDSFAEIPEVIELNGNYPNPFSGTTTLAYSLPKSGDVKIAVFNVLGQKVAEVVPGPQSAGNHRVDFVPAGLSSGLYMYRIELSHGADGATQQTAVGTMLLTK